ncbi:MAG: DMT family transporter [Bacteroidales bacterium]|nr:DMT family transporter [Bacteroidales bacterium]
MNVKSAREAYLFAILAVLFWSTCPTAFKLGLRHITTWQLLTGATLTSTVVLGILTAAKGNLKSLKTFTWKELVFSALMGILNPIAYYLILFKAYTILPAQVAQPLNMIWPIVLVLFAIPMLGQRVSWKSIGAMLLSFSGVMLVSLMGGTAGQHPQNRLGIFLALVSSVLWAFYFLLNTRDNRDPVTRLFLNFTFAAAFLLLAGIFTDHPFPASAEGWFAAIYVGVFEMGITFVLWLMAIRLAPSSDRISNLMYIAPFLNLLLASQVLGEKIYLTTVIGIILLVTGIVIQNITGKDAKQL